MGQLLHSNFFCLNFYTWKYGRQTLNRKGDFYPDTLMSGSKGSCFPLFRDFCCCFIQAFMARTILALKKPHIFMETSFNVIICNINNLRRILTFSLVQEFAFHSGSFDQLKSLTWLPPAWQILTSLLRFVLGSSWAKLDRFPKKLGLRKMRAKLPLRLVRVFLGLQGKGKSISPPAALSCEGCDTKASGLPSLDVKPCILPSPTWADWIFFFFP